MTQAKVKFASFADYLAWSDNMPPPQLVAEVLSPGKRNRDRDLVRKRDQYAARGIPEYWLLDAVLQAVTVLQWRDNIYTEIGVFRAGDRVISPTFPDLQLTAAQLFQSELQS